jgi:hypothetical protein
LFSHALRTIMNGHQNVHIGGYGLHVPQARALSGSASAPGTKGGETFTYTYYLCPWTPTNPRDVAHCPSYARACVREDHHRHLLFPDKCVLGHDRTDDHVPAR